MATEERHTGRLIDHIGLVVRDLAASKAFYSAVFGVLKIPMGSDGNDFFADELFIGVRDSEQVQGQGTARHSHRVPGARPRDGGCVLQSRSGARRQGQRRSR